MVNMRLRIILIPDTGLRTYVDTIHDLDLDSAELGTDLTSAVIALHQDYRTDQEAKK